MNDDLIPTSELTQAAFYLINNVPYHGARWTDPNSKEAVFLFEVPSEEVAMAWVKEGEKFRKFRKAIETLKDDIMGGRR